MNTISFYQSTNKLLHKIGLDVRRFPTRDQRRLISYLVKNNVSVCFDVGANMGQYATYLLSIGFKGNIISFEPQSAPFAHIAKLSKNNPNWQVYNYALGNEDGKAEINISANSFSSSILAIEQEHVLAAPESAFITKESIQVYRLDTVFPKLTTSDKIFLKIDTQGFEWNVLQGALNTLQNIYAIQLEVAMVPLYEREVLFNDIKAWIENKGFFISSIESGFANMETGKLLQAEMVFLREPSTFKQ